MSSCANHYDTKTLLVAGIIAMCHHLDLSEPIVYYLQVGKKKIPAFAVISYLFAYK